MKSLIPIAAAAVITLGSCSTVYRSGQTPDDIYYSPAPQQSAAAAAYVPANSGRSEGKRYNSGRNTYSAYDDFATMDDRWLMMRVRNRARWSAFDDYGYWSPFNTFGWGGGGLGWGGGGLGWGMSPGIHMGMGMGMGMGIGSFYSPYSFYNPFYNPYGSHFFNSYWNWNSFYNPYYPNVVVVNPKVNPAGYNTMRNLNINNYSNSNFNNRGTVAPRNGSGTRPRYNTVNSNSTLGNSFRRVFSNSNNSTINQRSNSSPRDSYRPSMQDRPVRTYSPSNNSTFGGSRSSGVSGGSSGGGIGGGSRPSRR